MIYPPFVLVGVRRQLRAHECKPSISCDLQHACASSFVRYRSLCIKEIDVTQKMRCIRAIDREILEFMQCPHAGHSRLHAQKTRACARWPEKPQIFARRGADKHRKGAPPWAESHRPPYETVRRSDGLNLKRVVLRKIHFSGYQKRGVWTTGQKSRPEHPDGPLNPAPVRVHCAAPSIRRIVRAAESAILYDTGEVG